MTRPGKEEMAPRTPCRPAFSLVELLVVIAIIAVLIGLLLPAVQKVRENAARAQCQNNIKQIALAVHSYHNTQRRLPHNLFDGYGPHHKNWSWLARLLPFLEQGNLYRSLDIETKTLFQSRDFAVARVEVFLCPSDAAYQQGPRADAADLGMWNPPFMDAGQTNYKGVAGANWDWGDLRWHNAGTNGSGDGADNGDGMFFRSDYRYPKTFAAISDGLSNTFMIGEDVPEKTKWCSWPYSNNAVGTCAIAPNARRPDGSDFDPWSWEDTYSFRSRHSGGLTFALADGSARFISDSIDLSLYRALATIRGGEAAQAP
jgi:prepilin-type N-terminal cleavage/methylation domain-containing protein/prepilin-type processing-associated H-X9-DG protein